MRDESSPNGNMDYERGPVNQPPKGGEGAG